MHKSKIVKLDTLLQDNDNARIHNRKNIDVIKSSIKEFGQYRPFVVQKSSMRVLVGNGLLKAMKQSGVTGKVKAIVLDLNDERANALAVLDNRSHDLSNFDEDKLFKQLENFDNKIKDLLEFEYLRPNDNDKELVFREPNKFDRQGEVGTYIVCGEYKFYISKSQYLKWKENMQLSAGFNATEQINEIKRMLKLNENAN